ncbi:MAG: UDP-glucuronic acid decarboxylase family protein [Kiritimatiellia bacterium]
MGTALVTGGAGFLGSNLCARLLRDGHRVVALDDFCTGSRANLAAFADNPDFTLVEADVADEATFRRLDGTRFSEIYNLACPASPPRYQAQPIRTTLTSVRGVLLCLELARRDGAKLLHASTSEVYGDAHVHPQPEGYWGNVNPIGVRSCYDEGKRVAETLVADHVRTYDVDARMVRIFNTYGPMMDPGDGRVVSNFVMQALRGEDLTVYGTGGQTRSFQYCDDLLDAFCAYMALPKAKLRAFFAPPRPAVPVLNTGNPGEFTVLELAEEILRQIPDTGSKLVFRPLPGDDPKQRKPDIALARELLGWEPKIPLAEGLARTIAYFRTRL